MKKFINKIKKRLHNTGSSLILVIVALAFIGILVGALLTAVAFSYRQKLYDYNAKSNFYYLDQAMDEIYAGVGAKTVEALTAAYEDTREQIISFDLESETYKNDTDEEANKKFKDNFMGKFADASGSTDYWKIVHSTDADQTAYKKSIVYAMTTMISNESIKLDDSKLKLQYIYVDTNGNPMAAKDNPDSSISVERLSKVVLKNVRLTRTSKYNRSTANGMFTQTISSDIEITRPDFNVAFDNLNVDMSTLFEYCLVADSGVDFDRVDGNILTISGNIYAASDFYNKDYNYYGGKKAGFTDTFTRVEDEKSISYPVNQVSRYRYVSPTDNDLFNNGHVASGDSAYDGKNLRSKYSGFYIDGGRVNILADTMIVPGSISVMNGGNLSVYGKNSADVELAEVWADEVVLAGYSLPGLNENSGVGASAFFNANMYVKDDTQIESDYSKLTFAGGYYGFSNSQTPDERSFIPTVAKAKASDNANIYQTELIDTNGNHIGAENRGHYNSSSILINGENATLDLTETENLFIAGRSYIELSKNKSGSSTKTVDANKSNGTPKDVTYDEKIYQYDTNLDDYKTGESVSIKSSQLAYYPSKASGKLEKDPTLFNTTTRKGKGTFTLSGGANGSILNSCNLMIKYFGNPSETEGIVIPLTIQEVTINPGTSVATDKTYYYIDFEEVVKRLTQSTDPTVQNIIANNRTFTSMGFPTNYADAQTNISYWADMVKQAFIKDYCDYFNFCVNKNSNEKLDWMGYEIDYDDPSMATARNLGLRMDSATFALTYPDTDTYILDDYDQRDRINKVAAELQNVTNYQDFKISKVELPKGTTDKINTSGSVTSTNKWLDEVISAGNNKYYVATSVDKNNYDTINSTLKGDVNGTNSHVTGNGSLTSTTGDFAADYSKHYNYVKYALKDVYTNSPESAFLDTMISANGEGGITPINYYMNYDQFTEIMNAFPTSASDPVGGIKPENLDLGQYKVWASEKDITIDGNPTGTTPQEITGIIVTKGDVYFRNVSQFNGLIICGGKVYITTSNSALASISSTKLCRNIIREVINKATKYRDVSSIPSDPTDPDYVDTSSTAFMQNQKDALTAIRFLKLFKAYYDIADKAEHGQYHKSSAKLDITNIDYSDVLRYNNWMRNVD